MWFWFSSAVVSVLASLYIRLGGLAEDNADLTDNILAAIYMFGATLLYGIGAILREIQKRR